MPESAKLRSPEPAGWIFPWTLAIQPGPMVTEDEP